MKLLSYNLSFYKKPMLIVAFLISCFSLFSQTNSSSKNDVDSVDFWISASKELVKSDQIKALTLAEKAIDVANRRQTTFDLAKAEFNLGIIYLKGANNNKAIPYFNSAIKGFKSIDSTKHKLNVQRRLGRAHYALGDYTKAMKIYMEALSEYEDLKIVNSDLGWLLRYIGSVFHREENFVKAMEYYVEAFKVFKKIESNDGLSSCYNTIGNVYRSIDNQNMALENYLQALKITEQTNNQSRISVIQENIGQVYQTQGNYGKAQYYFTKSYDYLIDSTSHALDYSILSQNRTSFGDLYRVKKEYKKALDYFNKAEEYAMRSDRKRMLRLQFVYQGKYQTFEALQDDAAALKYYKLYRNFNDSIKGSEVLNSVNEIETSYKSKKGNRLIDELNAEKDQLFVEKENEKENAKKAWTWIWWLMIGIIAVTIFSLVIFMQKRKITAANSSLVGQNIEAVKSEEKIKILENKVVGEQETPVDSKSDKYSKSALLDEQKEELIQRLNELMEFEKIYTKKDLTVVVVAKILNTNKSYISQVINEYLGINFSTYVNEYRVKEARRLLTDEQFRHLTIESIAGDSGFNSVSAFNNAFKKFTGLTPSYYLKSILERK